MRRFRASFSTEDEIQASEDEEVAPVVRMTRPKQPKKIVELPSDSEADSIESEVSLFLFVHS